jgi:hypothetical protein
MNNIEFTYYDKNDDQCYQKELLLFLNLNYDDDIFSKVDSIYSSFSFDLTSIYELLKKDKHIQFFTSPDYLFLFLFSYDYLYLFGPLLYSILNGLDYHYHYDKLLEKLNHI